MWLSHDRLVTGKFTRVTATVHTSKVRCFLLCWPQDLSSGLPEEDGGQPLASAVVLSHTRGRSLQSPFVGEEIEIPPLKLNFTGKFLGGTYILTA